MMLPHRSFSDFALHLHTNTIGPILTAQALLKSSIAIHSITFISSDSGSTQNFRDFEDGFAAYAASKAALNQALRHMAAELKRKAGSQTTILALHPGEVATDMASGVDISWEVEARTLSVDESVRACIGVIAGKGVQDSGTFWTWEDRVRGFQWNFFSERAVQAPANACTAISLVNSLPPTFFLKAGVCRF